MADDEKQRRDEDDAEGHSKTFQQPAERKVAPGEQPAAKDEDEDGDTSGHEMSAGQRPGDGKEDTSTKQHTGW